MQYHNKETDWPCLSIEVTLEYYTHLQKKKTEDRDDMNTDTKEQKILIVFTLNFSHKNTWSPQKTGSNSKKKMLRSVNIWEPVNLYRNLIFPAILQTFPLWDSWDKTTKKFQAYHEL